jgi:hypothetical protein
MVPTSWEKAIVYTLLFSSLEKVAGSFRRAAELRESRPRSGMIVQITLMTT